RFNAFLPPPCPTLRPRGLHPRARQIKNHSRPSQQRRRQRWHDPRRQHQMPLFQRHSPQSGVPHVKSKVNRRQNQAPHQRHLAGMHRHRLIPVLPAQPPEMQPHQRHCSYHQSPTRSRVSCPPRHRHQPPHIPAVNQRAQYQRLSPPSGRRRCRASCLSRCAGSRRQNPPKSSNCQRRQQPCHKPQINRQRQRCCLFAPSSSLRQITHRRLSQPAACHDQPDRPKPHHLHAPFRRRGRRAQNHPLAADPGQNSRGGGRGPCHCRQHPARLGRGSCGRRRPCSDADHSRRRRQRAQHSSRETFARRAAAQRRLDKFDDLLVQQFPPAR